jgi:hypothetical protein
MKAYEMMMMMMMMMMITHIGSMTQHNISGQFSLVERP